MGGCLCASVPHELDLDRMELSSGEPVAVEPQVFDVLAYLLRNRIACMNELLDNIWGDRFVSSRTTSRIKSARRRGRHRPRPAHHPDGAWPGLHRFVADLHEPAPAPAGTPSTAGGGPASLSAALDTLEGGTGRAVEVERAGREQRPPRRPGRDGAGAWPPRRPWELRRPRPHDPRRRRRRRRDRAAARDLLHAIPAGLPGRARAGPLGRTAGHPAALFVAVREVLVAAAAGGGVVVLLGGLHLADRCALSWPSSGA